VGGYRLLQQLKNNRGCALRHLDLSFTGLDDTAGLKLSKMLRKNKVPTLTALKVSHNRLGIDSGVAISEALKLNVHLVTFWIGYNRFDLDVTRQLIYAAEQVSNLINLALPVEFAPVLGRACCQFAA
jgi:Ran GTPase-activating protein (RanGAP) involved in mRNA processing and transport